LRFAAAAEIGVENSVVAAVIALSHFARIAP